MTALSDLVGSYIDRFGNTVILTRDRWEHHILPEHHEMARLLWSFGRVLLRPRRITQDTSLMSCRCFYSDGIAPGELVKIIVEYPPDDPNMPLYTPAAGTIITAFLVPTFTRRERQLWP